MKLAEGLLLRADLQKKIASLRERIVRSSLFQEGTQPLEDSNELISESVAVLNQLEELVVSINIANLNNKLPDGRTLTSAMAHRDTLIQHHALLQTAIASTQKEPDRYSARDIKWLSTVNVQKLQKQSEDLAKTTRELNGKIQETNWKVDL